MQLLQALLLLSLSATVVLVLLVTSTPSIVLVNPTATLDQNPSANNVCNCTLDKDKQISFLLLLH
jgi:hypothetical protein